MIKIILLIFLLMFISISTIEGFRNNNMTFKVSRNKYNGMNNNYLLRENDVSPLPTGFYSSLLNVAGVRDERRYFETPISLTTHSFNGDYFINNKLTDCPDLPGNCDVFNNVNSGRVYKDNKYSLPDPLNTYSKAKQNDKVLYDKKIIRDILSVHELNEEEIVKRANDHQ
jgi:hypothetical protein